MGGDKGILSGKTYFENLDSFRFLSALIVFIYHAYTLLDFRFSSKFLRIFHEHFFLNGNIGVIFFFVLSGFLISWQLIDEKFKTNKINIINFYLKRILRIWPVYFMVIIMGFLISVNFNLSNTLDFYSDYNVDISFLSWYIFFVANYTPVDINQIYTVLWSVSIEEQFYLIWPILIFIFNQKKVIYICLLILIFSFIYQLLNDVHPKSSLIHISSLAIGSLGAYFCRFNLDFINYFKLLSRKIVVILYIMFFVFSLVRGFDFLLNNSFLKLVSLFSYIYMSFFFLFVIIEQNFCINSFYKFGKLKIFSKLGKISYGIYAYHMVALFFTRLIFCNISFPISDFLLYFFKLIISFIFTILFSYISFNYMERYFSSFKEKLSN